MKKKKKSDLSAWVPKIEFVAHAIDADGNGDGGSHYDSLASACREARLIVDDGHAPSAKVERREWRKDPETGRPTFSDSDEVAYGAMGPLLEGGWIGPDWIGTDALVEGSIKRPCYLPPVSRKEVSR